LIIIMSTTHSGNIQPALDLEEHDGNNNAKRVNVVAGAISIDASDIQIGAVELKDGDTDTRADIESDGTKNALFVQANALPLPTGASTASNQTTIIGHVDGIEGLLTTIDSDTGTVAGAVSGSEMQVDVITMPTVTVQATNLDIRDLTATDVVTVTGGVGQTADVKVTLDSESVAVTGTFFQATQPVSVASLPLPTGASTLSEQQTQTTHLATIAGDTTSLDGKDFATQTTLSAINAKLVTGTDIGDVTINNASGASAVNIQDGGNSITVDGAVAISPTTDTLGSGSFTANGQTITGPTTSGFSSISFQITGTWSGVIAFEKTIDGSTWTPMAFYSHDINGGDSVTSTTTNGIFFSSVGSSQQVRARTTSWTSGTASLDVAVSIGVKAVAIDAQLPSGTNAIGKLAANSGVDIGDVDVLSLPAITGTVTANAGTNLNTSALALETGGNLATIAGKDFATQTTLAALNTKVTAVDTGAVVVSSSALPTGASTSALQGGGLPAALAAGGGLKVEGVAGGVAQPISGTVTANMGTVTADPFGANADAASATGSISAKLRFIAGTGIPVTSLPALATGSNTIGALTANQSVNVAQINGVTTTMGNGISGTGVQRVTIASDSTGQVTLASGATVAVTQATASNLNAQTVGNIAHDGIDSGNPVKVGMRAIAHGTNPTAVAAADRTDWLANRAGVPFVIGGHPNIVTLRTNYTAAQTNAALITVSAGTKIVVTRCSVLADNANSVDVQARVGFATATTPTTTGVVLSHPGIAAGSGVVEGDGSGILGVGADDEDLRITSEVPTSGSIDVMVSYYTIPS
jgi:hypothetical protein